jgi:hypothetical protein
MNIDNPTPTYLCTYLFTYPPIYQLTYLFTNQPIYQPLTYHLHTYLFTYACTHPPIYYLLSITYLSTHLPMNINPHAYLFTFYFLFQEPTYLIPVILQLATYLQHCLVMI